MIPIKLRIWDLVLRFAIQIGKYEKVVFCNRDCVGMFICGCRTGYG